MVDRATYKETKVAPVVDEAADERDGFRTVRRREGVEESGGLLPVRSPEQVVDLFQRDGAIGERDDHVEHALRVAEGALRVPGDRVERGGIRADLLLLDD